MGVYTVYWRYCGEQKMTETCGYCKKEFVRLSSHIRHCKAKKGETETREVLLNDNVGVVTHTISNMAYTSTGGPSTIISTTLKISRWQRFKNWFRRR